MKKSIMQTDLELCNIQKKMNYKGGTTACLSFIISHQNYETNEVTDKLYVANVGDSFIMLIDTVNEPSCLLTETHNLTSN